MFVVRLMAFALVIVGAYALGRALNGLLDACRRRDRLREPCHTTRRNGPESVP